MTFLERRGFLAGAGSLALTAGMLPALAQAAWPSRPVRFVVPLAPGGAMDFAARQCGTVLSRVLGQQVFIENRTGAGGTIGMDTAMKAVPDGYTFLFTNDNAAIAPHILNLAYDYTKELPPVSLITRQPIAFAVHPSLGVKTVAELVAYAKKIRSSALRRPVSGPTSMSSAPGSHAKPGSNSSMCPIAAPGRR
jgi:tripartite-type tricarboxylate transporter receptor subunit TctC